MKHRLITPSLVGQTSGRRVPVYIGSGLSNDINQIRQRHFKSDRLAVVTDRNVFSLHAVRVVNRLRESGITVDLDVLPPGERIKSAPTVATLHENWFKRGYDRTTPVIALGGGTVGDAVGFAAATFLRGLPLVQMPTTLIGQVDSAAGGKVGINHRRGKNLIGCFYQPAAIIVDPEFLGTLPVRELKSGLAEVVKYGIIRDSTLFATCESKAPRWISEVTQVSPDIIRRCLRIKLDVVEADEYDKALRHILNFGHTLGHAFEAAGHFKLLKHGEAVTLGMAAVSWMSHSRKLISSAGFERILGLCRLIAPSGRIQFLQAKRVTPYLRLDKKRVSGGNVWILPRRIGAVTFVSDVSDKDIRGAIEFVQNWAESRS